MSPRAYRLSVIGGLLSLGLGLLVLAVAQTDPGSGRLPPPQVSTYAPPQAIIFSAPLAAPAELPAITIAAEPYQHPSGAFSVRYPEGWQLDEAEDSVQFTGPEDSGQFSVTFVGAGAMVQANYSGDLQATWGDLPAFVIERIDATHWPDQWEAEFAFEQTLLPDGAVARLTGRTHYRAQNDLVYIFTSLVHPAYRAQLQPVFQSLLSSLQTDSTAAISDSE
jgi:hypothetical protein